MKFEQLRLQVAIHRAAETGFDPISDRNRHRLVLSVFHAWLTLYGESVFPFTISQVCETKVNLRKQSGNGPAHWEIAEAHNQFECFWKHRNKGPCDDSVERGHVVARSGGGDFTIENCMIECRAHNNQRRARTIEQYLSSGDITD